MSVSGGPSVNTTGLIFAYDMNSPRSMIGAPTTNILPNAGQNGRFTGSSRVGVPQSEWGTYNTNQYNGNTYFSIGTVTSVTGNIVTTAAAHPFRTFDAVTPQTTGGGVSAGTNYFIRSLSSTTFSIHAYNGSDDGSQGYIDTATGFFKVHENIALNTRITINATSFPTMWWGPPHLPNTCHVKELVQEGGYLPGTNCMRIHTTRTVGVDGGMAYGVFTPVTAGQSVTISWWHRTPDPRGVGVTIGWTTYFGPSAAAPSSSFTLSQTWQKFSLTWTASVTFSFYNYWFPPGAATPYAWDITDIQVEIGTISTPFVVGTRANTSVLTDQTGNNTITATSLTYASNNTFSFNGSSNNLSIGSFSGYSTNITCEAWFKTTSGATWKNIVCGPTNDIIFTVNGALLNFGCQGNVPIPHANFSTTTVNTGAWFHGVATYDGSNVRIYINGNLESTTARTGNIISGAKNSGSNSGGSSEYFDGTIANVRVYNRAISATEVQQNFNATRIQYGI